MPFWHASNTRGYSIDIDVFFAERHADTAAAVAALRSALDRDLGDFFTFDIAKVVPLQEEAKGSRMHVAARLGPKPFAAFHIDVVVGTTHAVEHYRARTTPYRACCSLRLACWVRLVGLSDGYASWPPAGQELGLVARPLPAVAVDLEEIRDARGEDEFGLDGLDSSAAELS